MHPTTKWFLERNDSAKPIRRRNQHQRELFGEVSRYQKQNPKSIHLAVAFILNMPEAAPSLEPGVMRAKTPCRKCLDHRNGRKCSLPARCGAPRSAPCLPRGDGKPRQYWGSPGPWLVASLPRGLGPEFPRWLADSTAGRKI